MLENALTSWSQESDIDLPALKALARPANEFKKKTIHMHCGTRTQDHEAVVTGHGARAEKFCLLNSLHRTLEQDVMV